MITQVHSYYAKFSYEYCLNESIPSIDRYFMPLPLTLSILSAVDSVLVLEKYTKTMFIIYFFVINILIFLQAFCHPFKNRLVCLINILFMVNYWLMVGVHLIFGSISAAAYIFLSSTAILLVFLILLFHCFHNCVHVYQNIFFQDQKKLS